MLDDVYKTFLWIILGIAGLGFFLGWLFPVEGPFDYVYDNYATQPAHRHPSTSGSLQPKQFIIDINDLSEEDFIALQEIFTNK